MFDLMSEAAHAQEMGQADHISLSLRFSIKTNKN